MFEKLNLPCQMFFGHVLKFLCFVYTCERANARSVIDYIINDTRVYACYLSDGIRHVSEV